MKLTIIVILLLIIIIIVVERHTPNTIESFETMKATININDTFDFSTEKYLSKFNESDLKSRNLVGQNLVEIYNNSIVNPSTTQKQICSEIINSICKHVTKRKHIKCMYEPWNIVLFKNIENNFPHTHKNIILFPLNKLKNSEENQITFLHEQLHVFQKEYSVVFDDLYENYWGFKKLSAPINIPFDTRTNPDTPNLYWVFHEHILLVKYNDSPTNLNDVTYIGYNINTNKSIELKNWKLFVDYFGTGNINYYHPDEISATMISNYCFNYNETTPAFNQMKRWYSKSLLI